jgi:hypothetical protein
MTTKNNNKIVPVESFPGQFKRAKALWNRLSHGKRKANPQQVTRELIDRIQKTNFKKK